MNAATSYSSGQGIDVTSTVDQLLQAESGPKTAMQSRQTIIQQQVAMLQSINGQLSALGTAVTALRDISGPLMAQSSTSSDPTKLAVSAGSNAASGTHLVEITSLASTASVYTDSVAKDSVLSGTLTFDVAGISESITIDENSDTLTELSSTLNAGDYGVKASVLHDAAGDKLVLISKTDGAAGAITNIAGPSGLTFRNGAAASNAEFTIDGVPFASATNQASGMLEDVNFTFSAKTSGAVRVTIGPDTTKATQAIQSFVTAYNALITTINGQFTYDATNNTVGTLSADSTLRVLQSTLLEQATTQVTSNPSLTTLRSLGIEMGNDGRLTVNSTVMNDAITNKTTEFRSFFQASETGFASKMGDLMMKLNNSSDGLLYVDIKGLNETNRSLTKQIEAFDARLESRRTSLISQYSHLDAELRQMPLLLNQISSQLGTKNS